MAPLEASTIENVSELASKLRPMAKLSVDFTPPARTVALPTSASATEFPGSATGGSSQPTGLTVHGSGGGGGGSHSEGFSMHGSGGGGGGLVGSHSCSWRRQGSVGSRTPPSIPPGLPWNGGRSSPAACAAAVPSSRRAVVAAKARAIRLMFDP